MFDIAFATDDSGLCGPTLQARPGLRILGLGDSFAMGYGDGQAETYLAQLGRLMEADTNSWPEQDLAYSGEESPADQVDLDAPERIVHRMGVTAGIELVEVLGRFRFHSQDEPLYFAVDPHLAPRATGWLHRLYSTTSVPTDPTGALGRSGRFPVPGSGLTAGKRGSILLKEKGMLPVEGGWPWPGK